MTAPGRTQTVRATVAVSYKRQRKERSSKDTIVMFDFDLITYILTLIDVQSTQFVTICAGYAVPCYSMIDMCPSVRLQEEWETIAVLSGYECAIYLLKLSVKRFCFSRCTTALHNRI